MVLEFNLIELYMCYKKITAEKQMKLWIIIQVIRIWNLSFGHTSVKPIGIVCVLSNSVLLLYFFLARAKVTLTRMGPAVWNGGFSTFLAFVLLINTDSHIFTTFFKVILR